MGGRLGQLLLVDDDAELVELVRRVLAGHEHVLTVASTGEAARALLAHTTYDLLIVDGLLPDGRGTDLLRELAASETPTKAMFISSSWQEVSEVASRARELRVSRALRKPLDAATFPLEVSYALKHELPFAPPRESVAALDDMIAQFRQRLVGRVAAFEGALREARTTGGNVDSIASLHAEAHKLHGTAGSFGYDQVSTAAETIENALHDAIGKGSIVSDDAWRRIVSASDRMVSALSAAPRAVGTDDTAKPCVLIVDDDPMLLRSIANDLSAVIEVMSATTAEGALSIAHSVPLACIVIDVHLGSRFQGFELAKALRTQPTSERVPVIFMSADSSLDTQIGGMHAGGSLFLNKPLTAAPVLDAVRRVTEIEARGRPRVVLLDDDRDFCLAVERVLSRANVDLHAVQDEAKLLELLATENPALLLLDVRLNGVSGLDICRMLRANPRWENLDIVLVTAENSVELRIAAFRAGASDYVSKPVIPEELVARVMSRIERHTLREERTTRDNLTGLLMRGPFAEAFQRMLKLTQRNETQMSLCLLDIDHFKSINDRYGHMNGDRVLATLGQLLNRRFRGEDLRCRWGGEEIVLALSGSPRAEATLALERLLVEFQSTTFNDGKHPPYHATFSAGVASYPADGQTLDELIAVADARMYTAKRNGRARIVSQ